MKRDILDFFSELSSDEIFTSPTLANKMLDLLPIEIWRNKEAKFLDPCCKSGVFLREIVKRLFIGLEKQIPNDKERIKHILHNQVYGIAITEITHLMTKRTVYCSKFANSNNTLIQAPIFDDEDGNIFYYNKSDNKYAYPFIQETKDQGNKIKELLTKMRFDVIIGNPPYQKNYGNTGGNKSKAQNIYHLFIEKALALKPKHLVMIVPSRWMIKSADGISDKWVDKMIDCNHFKVMHDFESSEKLFPGLEHKIKGGGTVLSSRARL